MKSHFEKKNDPVIEGLNTKDHLTQFSPIFLIYQSKLNQQPICKSSPEVKPTRWNLIYLFDNLKLVCTQSTALMSEELSRNQTNMI